MRLLFIDRDFGGRYAHAARHLAAAGHDVTAIGRSGSTSAPLAGIRQVAYRPCRHGAAAHPGARGLETAVAAGVGVMQVCARLDRDGFVPDIVIGAGGAGETFYVKEVWPDCPVLGYCEGFVGAGIAASGSATPTDTRRAIELLALQACDWGQAPTAWQRSQYPARYWPRISVVPHGVDTAHARPDPSARLWLGGGPSLGAGDEVVACRVDAAGVGSCAGIVPQVFAGILHARPRLHVLAWAAPSDDGAPPNRLPPALEGCDPRRVHFLGTLSNGLLSSVLQVARVHLHLAPAVGGEGGLIDSLSRGAVIVGWRHPAAAEIVRDGVSGFLIDPADLDGLVASAASAFANDCESIRAEARETAVARYDRDQVCLPAYGRLLHSLVGGTRCG